MGPVRFEKQREAGWENCEAFSGAGVRGPRPHKLFTRSPVFFVPLRRWVSLPSFLPSSLPLIWLPWPSLLSRIFPFPKLLTDTPLCPLWGLLEEPRLLGGFYVSALLRDQFHTFLNDCILGATLPMFPFFLTWFKFSFATLTGDRLLFPHYRSFGCLI